MLPKNIEENNVRYQTKLQLVLTYIDTYHRNGTLSATFASMPVCPGLEASGKIIKIGNKVSNFKIGDRVCYASTPLGAYCEIRDFLLQKQ